MALPSALVDQVHDWPLFSSSSFSRFVCSASKQREPRRFSSHIKQLAHKTESQASRNLACAFRGRLVKRTHASASSVHVFVVVGRWANKRTIYSDGPSFEWIKFMEFVILVPALIIRQARGGMSELDELKGRKLHLRCSIH